MTIFNKLLRVHQHLFDSNSNRANLMNSNDELAQQYDHKLDYETLSGNIKYKNVYMQKYIFSIKYTSVMDINCDFPSLQL